MTAIPVLLALAASVSAAETESTQDGATSAPAFMPWNLVIGKGQAGRHRLWFSKPPPARVRVMLDGENGRHVELDIDPAHGAKLVRVLRLEEGAWRVSIWSEPIVIASQAPGTSPKYLVLHLVPREGGGAFCAVGTLVDFYALPTPTKGAPTGGCSDASTAENAWSLHLVPESRTGSPSLLSASPTLDSSRRSLDSPITAGTNDFLQILAQIAMERAQSRGLDLMAERLRDWVCRDLTWGEVVAPSLLAMGVSPANPEARMGLGMRPDGRPRAPLPPGQRETQVGGSLPSGTVEAPARKVTAARDASGVPWETTALQSGPPSSAAAPGALLLPATCSVVKGLRLHEIATSGRTFQRALASDVAGIGMNATLQLAPGDNDKLMREVVAALSPLMAKAASGTPLNDRDAQFLLLSVLRAASHHAGGGTALACSVSVVVSAVNECQASGGCNADDVVRLLDSFSDGLSPQCSANPTPLWQDAGLFVGRVMDVLVPKPNTPPRATTLAAIELTLDLAERAVTETCASAVQAAEQVNRCAVAGQVLGVLRSVGRGVVEGDPQPVMVGVSSFLGLLEDARVRRCRGDDGQGLVPLGSMTSLKCDSEAAALARRTLRVAGAFAAFASVAADQRDAKLLEADREARKKTVESIIDSMTDRTSREGDEIVSLGTSVGFTHDVSSRDLYLELPLGVAWQRMPRRADHVNGRRYRCGAHLQVSALDLGRWLDVNRRGTLEEPRWRDVLFVSAQVAVVFNTAAHPFLAGFEAGGAPSLGRGKQERPPNRLGFFFAYYVPFMDLN